MQKKPLAIGLIVLLLCAILAWFLWPRDDQRPAASDPSVAVKKPLYPVIDTHTHLHPKAYGEAVRLMDALGIQAMVNLSGSSPGGRLEKQLAAAARYPGRFAVLMTPDFSLLDEPKGPQKLAASLAKAVKLGAKGLKIYKSLGLRLTNEAGDLLPVDTPLLSPLWTMAGKLKVPVAIHVGDPKAFFQPLTKTNERYEELALNPHWSFADRKKYPSWETLYKQFLRVVKRHPKTTFIGLHFGNNPEDVAAVGKAMDAHPNLHIDIAARLPEIGRQKTAMVRRMFIRHQERILFATDLALRPNQGKERVKQPFAYTLGAPMKPPPTPAAALAYFWRHWTFLQTDKRNLRNPTPIQGRWPIHGLKLPPKVLRKLYYANAAKLFGFSTPKKSLPR